MSSVMSAGLPPLVSHDKVVASPSAKFLGTILTATFGGSEKVFFYILISPNVSKL